MRRTVSIRTTRLAWWTLVGAIFLGGMTGCNQLRLPRIDPSGERLFLPAPNYTTIVPPNEVVCVPEPAYPAPPPIPQCNQPPPANPATSARQRSLLHGPRTPTGKKGYLVLMPGKISAPVGTEVVLLAGFCANDGFLMTDQPIQWTIAPDSVGHFVSSNTSPTSWIHRRVEKVETNYALTRTLHAEYLLTRGTQKKSDDVTVRRGQSWVSVTSPTSGTTYVTVVAPNAENWDQRRKTAVIFWVDAQWQFPAPATARAGEAIPLVTRVTRKDGTPITGWKVRYQLPPGNAVFGETGQAAVEATTDRQGEARATVRQSTPGPETVVVSIEVLRSESDGRALPLGKGQTTVHWSAPGLHLRATGPTTLKVGAVGIYRMEITNPGDVATRQVSLSVNLPEGLEFLNSTPNAQVFGRQLQWNLGELPPRATRVVDATCKATRPGSIRWTAVATSADVARMEAAVDTRVLPAAGLAARWVNPPQAARVGDEVTYVVEVRNVSNQPIPDVMITSQFDEGLRHVEGVASPIRRALGTLAPGQQTGVTIQLRTVRAGQWHHRVDITSSSGQSASLETVLNVAEAARSTQPPPSTPPSTTPGSPRPPAPGESPLEVSITGDTQRRAGESARYTIAVRNQSTRPVKNVRLVVGFDPALRPTKASGDHQVEDGELVFELPQLEPGKEMTRVVIAECTAPAAQAEVRATATAEGNVHAEKNITTVIHAATRAAPSPAARTNRLQLKVYDVRDPVRLGQRTTYVIQVTNDRPTSDRNIQLKIEVPKSLTIEQLGTTLAVVDQSPDGRVLTLEPIKELRPGESIREIRIEVTAKGPGRSGKIRVEATSELERQPVVAEETTTLVMP